MVWVSSSGFFLHTYALKVMPPIYFHRNNNKENNNTIWSLSRMWLVFHVTVTIAETNQPTTSLCSHPLLGPRKCLESIDECQWVSSFSTWRNSIPHLRFIHTSMSDAILSDCPSAAICHTATNVTEYWWEGSTSTAIPPTSVSDVVGRHGKVGGFSFRAALIQMH